jgi:hypothetical protein
MGIVAALVIIVAGPLHADVAVDVASGAPDNIFPSGGTTHGWQFSVNVPIEVTHLGLYDRLQDGFHMDHPIGLFDEQGTLLADNVISAGAGDLLIENFRYVPIADITTGDGIILSPGTEYTVGFYSEIFVQIDGMVVFDGFHTIHPAIDYVGFGVSDFTDGLQMPTGQDPGSHRWGPNLQFTIVPAPAAAWLLGPALLLRRRRRPCLTGTARSCPEAPGSR